MDGTTKQLRKTNLSAVSNGARLFADRLDLRTPRGRRFKDLIATYTKAIGKPTEAQAALVRDLALMQVLSEDIQLEFMDTGKIDHAQHSRVVNMMRRHMKTLGLFNVSKPDGDPDDDMGPLEYARRGGSKRSRQKLDDDEEED
ncbi:hypothetical protein JQ620_15345 [Bradyrhizobium sp. AUGA SZCCT0274]|uniref:hypothetical protein n=1 Tax=Bradyrhizobium sp. AUGA SZCCT0274 TaxID=2807670 RepID=UPI001BAB9976|nr:hypothetical protein [Bradyrhizobium sp. AUGA SZCCT0274]MBR1241504.1 hypothetical protein [Bradyrhizobium sp. AUGA SZCCT0274]